jgi:glycerophosphoryl diester phosphodiesterase
MKPLIEAHRGYSGRFPENTLLAFRKAIEAGAVSIELDIRTSKDGELMVLHDATLDRTSNGSGTFAETNAADAKKLDFGSWKGKEFAGEKIPFLEEALELTLTSNVYYNIEIKQFAETSSAEKLVALIHKYAPRGCSHIVSSFDLEALLQVRAVDNSIPLAIIGSDGDQMLEIAKKHDFPWIHCAFPRIGRDLFFRAHSSGIKINVWTVDQISKLQYFAGLGADKICTNYAAEMLQI